MLTDSECVSLPCMGAGQGLFGWIVHFVRRSPRVLIGVAAVFTVCAGIYGLPASQRLPAGGYDVPGAPSLQAQRLLQDEFGVGGNPIFFTVTATDSARSSEAIAVARRIVTELQDSPYIRQIAWYGQENQGSVNPLVSEDGRTGLVVARLDGDDTDAPTRARTIATPLIGDHDGVRVQAGGQALTYDAGNRQSREDLILMEVIAFPITFLALVWIFGSVVAAMVPLAVAVFAIAGTTAALSILNIATPVSIFGVNVATALSLALAIDYTLFMITRYREELAAGAPPEKALRTTMFTAGRTVLYSALTMACTVAVMLIFPQYLLKSLAYASIFSVILSLVGALLLAPALLVVLGDRLEWLTFRRFFGRGRTPGEQGAILRGDRTWTRIAAFCTDRPVSVIVMVGAILVILGYPVLHIKLAYPDDRVLPSSQSARMAGDIVRSEFSQNFIATSRIVIPENVTSATAVDDYARRLSEIPGVKSASAPGGIFVGGHRVAPGNQTTADIRGSKAYVSVTTNASPFGADGRAQLDAIKSAPAPAPVLVDSLAQKNVDNIAGITDRLPTVMVAIVLVTFVLIFLMTGSVILPVKALLMNVMSLCVAFGALVWIFQDGHLGALGTTATGHFTAFIPPLLACIAYALAIDYEIFVLSRIREARLALDGAVDANKRAVASGLVHTGRIVTAAASVMIVVFVAISAGEVAFMRGLGIGLAVGVAVDAFLVRPLLVPAFMQLMGNLNWWAPGPLARWHRRWGPTEESGPVGVRHAPGADYPGSAPQPR